MKFRLMYFVVLEGTDAPKDIMWKMLSARDAETGKGFDEKSIRDNILSLFIAGHEVIEQSLRFGDI